MRLPLVWLFLGSAGCCLVVVVLSRPGLGGTSRVAPPTFAPDEKHYVTPRQLTAAGVLAERHVRPLSDRPLVLLFLKQGCPCNDDFEPFFQRLRRAYGDRLDFAGVIDAERHEASYRVLPDPARELIRLFQVENGGYLILQRPDGTLDAVWPGWSREMFAEVGRRAAALAGVPERPLDPEGLPHALTTGCPYDP